MPIYAYTCKACNHQEELLKSIHKSDEIETCPKCKEPMVKKLNSSFVIDQQGYSYNTGERSIYKKHS